MHFHVAASRKSHKSSVHGGTHFSEVEGSEDFRCLLEV